MPLPSIPAAFHWTTESWGSALRCRPLEQIATHLFTTRQLQLQDAGDVKRLADAVAAARVAMVNQVHKADVVVIRVGEPDRSAGADSSPSPIPGDARPDADVLVSNDPTVAITVRAADCVPILIADRLTGAVAAVHAGWRGTAARAVVAAVDALCANFGAQPANLVAAIGPSIGSCCYEVGSAVVDAFAAAGHERHLVGRWFLSAPPRRGAPEYSPLFLDLAGANRDQLVLAGMAERNVHLSGLCTAMNLDVLTSFRLEREQAGRIAGAIVAARR